MVSFVPCFSVRIRRPAVDLRNSGSIGLGFCADTSDRAKLLIDVLLITFGLGLVAKGGDLFVDSSIYIGRVLRIPRFVIGGTLVSVATTIPELAVSALASVQDNPGIALGNALGSCICNIGLIVGTVCVLTPVEVQRHDFIRRSAWMVSAAILVVAFTWNGTLAPELAGVLMLLSLAYLCWDLLGIRRARAQSDTDIVTDVSSLGPAIGWFVLGAGLILVGSRLLVESGQSLAVAFGVPSAIIGLSVVAIGTSLPELVTGVSAVRKGVPDLSLGNIIGANVLNLYLIVGMSGMITPLLVDRFAQFYSYGWLGVFIAAFIGLSVRAGRIYRGTGIILLSLYVIYVSGLALISTFPIG